MSARAHRRPRDIRPTFDDHFPSRRAGHGSVRRYACVVSNCRGGESCTCAKGDNIDDWSEERGLPVSSKRERKRREEREGKRERYEPYTGPVAVLVWSTDPHEKVNRAKAREVA